MKEDDYLKLLEAHDLLTIHTAVSNAPIDEMCDALLIPGKIVEKFLHNLGYTVEEFKILSGQDIKRLDSQRAGTDQKTDEKLTLRKIHTTAREVGFINQTASTLGFKCHTLFMRQLGVVDVTFDELKDMNSKAAILKFGEQYEKEIPYKRHEKRARAPISVERIHDVCQRTGAITNAAGLACIDVASLKIRLNTINTDFKTLHAMTIDEAKAKFGDNYEKPIDLKIKAQKRSTTVLDEDKDSSPKSPGSAVKRRPTSPTSSFFQPNSAADSDEQQEATEGNNLDIRRVTLGGDE